MENQDEIRKAFERCYPISAPSRWDCMSHREKREWGRFKTGYKAALEAQAGQSVAWVDDKSGDLHIVLYSGKTGPAPRPAVPEGYNNHLEQAHAALRLAKEMFIANDCILPHTFEVIDDALSAPQGVNHDPRSKSKRPR